MRPLIEFDDEKPEGIDFDGGAGPGSESWKNALAPARVETATLQLPILEPAS